MHTYETQKRLEPRYLRASNVVCCRVLLRYLDAIPISLADSSRAGRPGVVPHVLWPRLPCSFRTATCFSGDLGGGIYRLPKSALALWASWMR